MTPMHPRAIAAALHGRLRALFARRRLEQYMNEELQFHLDMETEKNLRAGMTPADARRAAMISFGGVDRIVEEHRDARGTRLLEDALDDARYAMRVLARTPAFVAVSVFTLALAIAVGASLFTAVNGFFLRSLPVPDGARLVSVFTSSSGSTSRGASSYLDLVDFAQAAGPLAELAAEARVETAVEIGEEMALLNGAFVTPGYFATLRLKPAHGRLPAADVAGDDHTIVISHSLWQRAFGAEPSAIGKQLQVNGQLFRVAAVAPREFLGTNRELAEEYWIDARFAKLVLPGEDLLNVRGNRRFRIVGRIAPGGTLSALTARLELVGARLRAGDPESWTDEQGRNRRVTAMFERDAWIAGIASGDLLLIVGGVVAMGLGLLALASANLASLQMARAAVRRREIATRLALGAGRWRLLRQLITESAVIAVPGGILGLALAGVMARVAAQYRPPGLPGADLSLDLKTVLFTAAGVVVALMVFGLLPALQSVRGDLLTDLKHGATVGRRGVRLGGIRGSLIVAQVALSVTFTASAGLIAIALARYAGENRVDASRVLVAPLTLLPAAGDSVRSAAVIREIVSRIGALPGIQLASMAHYVPNSGSRATVEVTQPDAADPVTTRVIETNLVRPGYFDVVGLRLNRGRDFEEREMSGRARAAIVSSALAERLWPRQDPIGRRLRVGARGDAVEIIGVAGEQRIDRSQSSVGLLYLPMTPGSMSRMVLHVRLERPGNALASSVARALRQYRASVVAAEVVPLQRLMDRAVMPQRVAARASGVLALLQFALALTGVAGLVSYVTAQRRREIGIRMALGAGGRSILGLVLRQAARLMATGGVVGFALSIAVGRIVGTTIPVTAIAQLAAPTVAVACFATLSIGAMLWLARRALAVTPAAALRVD